MKKLYRIVQIDHRGNLQFNTVGYDFALKSDAIRGAIELEKNSVFTFCVYELPKMKKVWPLQKEVL